MIKYLFLAAALAVLVPATVARAQGCSGGVAFSNPPTVGTPIRDRAVGVLVSINEARPHLPARIITGLAGRIHHAADHARANAEARHMARAGCGGSSATFAAAPAGCGGGMAVVSTVTYARMPVGPVLPRAVRVAAVACPNGVCPAPAAIQAAPKAAPIAAVVPDKMGSLAGRIPWVRILPFVLKYGGDFLKLEPYLVPLVATHGWQVLYNSAVDLWILKAVQAMNAVPPQPIPPVPVL